MPGHQLLAATDTATGPGPLQQKMVSTEQKMGFNQENRPYHGRYDHREVFLKLGYNIWLVGGLNPCEKYEFVNWDDDIPNISGKIEKWQPNHQPV